MSISFISVTLCLGHYAGRRVAGASWLKSCRDKYDPMLPGECIRAGLWISENVRILAHPLLKQTTSLQTCPRAAGCDVTFKQTKILGPLKQSIPQSTGGRTVDVDKDKAIGEPFWRKNRQKGPMNWPNETQPAGQQTERTCGMCHEKSRVF